MLIKDQAETYMASQAARKRSPVKATSLRAYRSHLNSHILPFFGELEIAAVQNAEMKAFVNCLVGKNLSPNTINANLTVIKAVIASATDSNGNRLYPTNWNSDFIDAPLVLDDEENAPVIPLASLNQAILGGYKGFRPMYALLAASGLRIGECTALRTGVDNGKTSFWDKEQGMIRVRTQIQDGEETSPKTSAGAREIELAPAVNGYLKEQLKDRDGILFPNRNGGFLVVKTIYRHGEKNGIPGFHSLRRFRLTHLRGASVPEDLIQFWMGHARKTVTDRYSRLSQDVEFRQNWCEKAGVGFQIAG
jgi:integrase